MWQMKRRIKYFQAPGRFAGKGRSNVSSWCEHARRESGSEPRVPPRADGLEASRCCGGWFPPHDTESEVPVELLRSPWSPCHRRVQAAEHQETGAARVAQGTRDGDLASGRGSPGTSWASALRRARQSPGSRSPRAASFFSANDSRF